MFDNSFFISLIGFLIILTPLVFIHELGHYIAAKKNGVKVEQFSVGFGTELFGFNDKDNTRWKFCILPFGGYVKMKGELLVNSKNYKNINNGGGNFNNASLLSRLIIVFSGPLANILLGIFLITLLYSFHGRYETKPIIDKVVENSPAERSGLRSKDIILSIDNQKVSFFSDLKSIINQDGKTVKIQVKRNEKILFLNVTPELINLKGSSQTFYRIGIIAPKPVLVKTSILSSIYYGLKDTVILTLEWLKGFLQIISLNVSKNDIAGPIGIAEISGNALSSGLVSIIFLMAILSINLGLINLLPIPALDGGYILMYILEFFLKKPLSENIQLRLIQFGVFLLISLMVFVTFLDIQKLFV